MYSLLNRYMEGSQQNSRGENCWISDHEFTPILHQDITQNYNDKNRNAILPPGKFFLIDTTIRPNGPHAIFFITLKAHAADRNAY